MATFLDNLLNILMPLAIFIFFGAAIYKGVQEPIDMFVAWIKGLFADIIEEDTGEFDIWDHDVTYK